MLNITPSFCKPVINPSFDALFKKRQNRVLMEGGIMGGGSPKVFVDYGDGHYQIMTQEEFSKNYDHVRGPIYITKPDPIPKDITAPDTPYEYYDKYDDPQTLEHGQVLLEETDYPGKHYFNSAYYFLRIYTPEDPNDQEALEVVQKARSMVNISEISSQEEVQTEADRIFGNRRYKLAISGYSAPPAGYGRFINKFLNQLVSRLSPEQVGIVSSPSLDEGSIDRACTVISHSKELPILYVTAEGYLPYVDPEHMSLNKTGFNKDTFDNASKLFFKDPTEYSEATATASNAMIVMSGGRTATFNDMRNALQQNNKVVIVNNKKITEKAWDSSKPRVNNTAKYVKGILEDQDPALLGTILPADLALLEQKYSEGSILIVNIEEGQSVYDQEVQDIKAFLDK